MSQSKDWIWLQESVLLAVHDEQIDEHGGLSGIRDLALFQSAINRPQNLAAYGEPDHAALAASYGYGLAKNHPFNDGNKRTAFVAVELFLALNGYELVADDANCVLTTLTLAAGQMSEAEFGQWVREHCQ